MKPTKKIDVGSINWELIAPGDFICKRGKYILRVSVMDYRIWWFQVYYNGIELVAGLYTVQTKEEAIKRALKLYRLDKECRLIASNNSQVLPNSG